MLWMYTISNYSIYMLVPSFNYNCIHQFNELKKNDLLYSVIFRIYYECIMCSFFWLYTGYMMHVSYYDCNINNSGKSLACMANINNNFIYIYIYI